ncbi:hypothetical protein GCM10009700_33080 [Brevibacterium sanguinis]
MREGPHRAHVGEVLGGGFDAEGVPVQPRAREVLVLDEHVGSRDEPAREIRHGGIVAWADDLDGTCASVGEKAVEHVRFAEFGQLWHTSNPIGTIR